MISIHSLPVAGLFLAFGVIATTIAIQQFRKPEVRQHAPNNLAMAAIYFMCTFTYPIMFIRTGLAQAWQDTFYTLGALLMYAFICVLMYFVVREFTWTRRDPSRRETRGYVLFLRETNNFEYNAARDASRKLLHLVVVGVVIGFHAIPHLLSDFMQSMGITPMGFSIFAIVTVGYAFITMFMMADTLRLLNGNSLFHLTPDWAHKWFKASLKESETQTIISSVPIVLGLMPFIFSPFWVFVTVSLVASLSDALASVVGKRFGTHHLGSNPKKTWEGLIAGGVATFLFVYLGYYIYSDWLLEFWQVSIIAAAVTTGIVLIDAFAKRIMDNILNPLVCGAILVACLNIFGILP